eukprot:tig00021017_g17205.t1
MRRGALFVLLLVAGAAIVAAHGHKEHEKKDGDKHGDHAKLRHRDHDEGHGPRGDGPRGAWGPGPGPHGPPGPHGGPLEEFEELIRPGGPANVDKCQSEKGEALSVCAMKTIAALEDFLRMTMQRMREWHGRGGPHGGPGANGGPHGHGGRSLLCHGHEEGPMPPMPEIPDARKCDALQGDEKGKCLVEDFDQLEQTVRNWIRMRMERWGRAGPGGPEGPRGAMGPGFKGGEHRMAIPERMATRAEHGHDEPAGKKMRGEMPPPPRGEMPPPPPRGEMPPPPPRGEMPPGPPLPAWHSSGSPAEPVSEHRVVPARARPRAPPAPSELDKCRALAGDERVACLLGAVRTFEMRLDAFGRMLHARMEQRRRMAHRFFGMGAKHGFVAGVVSVLLLVGLARLACCCVRRVRARRDLALPAFRWEVPSVQLGETVRRLLQRHNYSLVRADSAGSVEAGQRAPLLAEEARPAPAPEPAPLSQAHFPPMYPRMPPRPGRRRGPAAAPHAAGWAHFPAPPPAYYPAPPPYYAPGPPPATAPAAPQQPPHSLLD